MLAFSFCAFFFLSIFMNIFSLHYFVCRFFQSGSYISLPFATIKREKKPKNLNWCHAYVQKYTFTRSGKHNSVFIFIFIVILARAHLRVFILILFIYFFFSYFFLFFFHSTIPFTWTTAIIYKLIEKWVAFVWHENIHSKTKMITEWNRSKMRKKEIKVYKKRLSRDTKICI